MPPKRKEVSTAAAEQTEPTGRRTRASSRAISSNSTTASSTRASSRAISSNSTTATSTSASRRPDTSSEVESSRGETGARAASQSAASSKTSRAESTSQSPTNSESSRARSARPSSPVPVSTSGDAAPSSRSPTSSVSSTERNSQPASTSTTEVQSGHIRQLGPSIRGTKLTAYRHILAASASASISSSNRSTNEAGNSAAPSAEVQRSSQNVPVSVQSGNKRRAMTVEEGTINLPRGVWLGDDSIFVIGANVSSNRAAVPEAPISSQDVTNQQVSSQDATSTPPRGAEARNGITSTESDESDIFDSDDDDSFQPGANVSVDFNDFNATVDLTSPAQPVPVPVLRMGTPTVRAAPIFRRPSESLLQQDDLDDDMSELTLTSPPVTPPHYSGFLMTQRRNNLGDMTIDLTDSPVPSASHEQNSLDAAPAPSASAELNSLCPAPGSTSHIKCPVCLDDLLRSHRPGGTSCPRPAGTSSVPRVSRSA